MRPLPDRPGRTADQSASDFQASGPARVAVYYAPPEADPLFAAGAAWLGRNPATHAATTQPPLPGIAALTADARLYGFHATLKPPMRLAPGRGWPDLLEASRRIAAGIAPFDLPPLRVADLSGFLALQERAPCPPLQAFCDIWVEGLDPWRAPASAAELDRRRAAGLSPEQDAMLFRWGYPYLFGAWFFHMTLSRRLSGDELAYWRPQAEAHFRDVLAIPRRVTDVCLCTQAAPGQPFTIAARLPLAGTASAVR